MDALRPQLKAVLRDVAHTEAETELSDTTCVYAMNASLPLSAAIKIYDLCEAKGFKAFVGMVRLKGDAFKLVLRILKRSDRTESQFTLPSTKRKRSTHEELAIDIARACEEQALRSVEAAVGTRLTDLDQTKLPPHHRAAKRAMAGLLALCKTNVEADRCVSTVFLNVSTKQTSGVSAPAPSPASEPATVASQCPPPLVLALRLASGFPLDVSWLTFWMPRSALKDGVFTCSSDRLGSVLSASENGRESACKTLGLETCTLLVGMAVTSASDEVEDGAAPSVETLCLQQARKANPSPVESESDTFADNVRRLWRRRRSSQ